MCRRTVPECAERKGLQPAAAHPLSVTGRPLT